MPLRLALFDLWGTLIADNPDAMTRRSELRLRRVADGLRALGFDYDEAAIQAAFAAAAEEHGRIHAEGRDITAEARTILYLRHLDETLPDRLDDDGWRRMHEAILTPALEVPPLVVPDADETLAQVKSLGLPLGLISNAGITPGFVLRRILDDHGLLRHFDDTIFSDEAELAKPAAAIFEQALENFGVAPDEAVFVGDQPVLDVLGPQGAGIWSVQLGDVREDGIEPHRRIPRLADLVPALQELDLL